jgi:hypothetical protein
MALRVRTTLRLALLIGALATVLALPAPASAKLPPSGLWECVILPPEIGTPSIYLGDLRIKGDKYKVDDSGWGKMKSPGGRKIKFTTGVWKGLWRGEWERTSTGVLEIALTDIKENFETAYCTKA